MLTKENLISKRERKLINQQEKLAQKEKQERLKKVEEEIMTEVKKVRVKKQAIEKKIAREKADYQFKVNDRVRLFDGNAKGTIEKIEKNIATINYGFFTAKTNVDQLELVQAAKK